MTSCFKALKHQADHKPCPGAENKLPGREGMIGEDHCGSALQQYLSRESPSLLRGGLVIKEERIKKDRSENDETSSLVSPKATMEDEQIAQKCFL